MTRRRFSPTEIAEALRAVEAGVRVPEVCHRFGVSELTLNRWRRKAGLLKKPLQRVVPPPVSVEHAASRIGGLEHRLEAFRLVMVNLLEPAELEQAARLLEASLSVSAMRARLLIGLPTRKRAGRPNGDCEELQIADRQAGTYLLREAKES
jgi:transposase-like protein